MKTRSYVGGKLPTVASIITALVVPVTLHAQAIENPGFEDAETPIGWRTQDAGIDDSVMHSGVRSVRLRRTGDPNFGGRALQTMPAAQYRGVLLRLSAWIRADDVRDGYAGLLLRVDGPNGLVAVDDMSDRPVTGTAEWGLHTVEVPVPAEAEKITVGAILPARGTAWFDDLALDTARVAVLPSPTAKAHAYLTRALDTIQARSMMRDSIDWKELRAEVFEGAVGALTPRDTHRSIVSALRRLGDGHSFFVVPSAAREMATRSDAELTRRLPPATQTLPGGVGYVLVPGMMGGSPEALVQLAQSIQDAIRGIERATDGACGWVIDLRQNTGGNMWPMLAGLGPILGEGTAGAFVEPDGNRTDWGYSRGFAWEGSDTVVTVRDPHELSNANPPVAVLVGPRTASSGEAIAVAFEGRPKSRIFGAPTRGRSTANSTITLCDGALLVLTTAVFADRNGRTYGGPIAPDVTVSSQERGVAEVRAGSLERDRLVARALAWLQSEESCAIH